MRRPTAFVLWLAHLSRADEPPSHTYLGCYVDKTKKRDLEERVDGTIVNDISAVSNGPRWCAEVCHSLGFPYFGLQTLICFCGSAYGSYGAAKDSACRHACPDLSGVMCGGHLLNSRSSRPGGSRARCWGCTRSAPTSGRGANPRI